MTTAFYAPPSAIEGNRVLLPEDEARHATRALRHQAGDEIIVVDGRGTWYRVQLDQVGERRAAGTVLEAEEGVGEPAYDLTIGIGLLKNRNRFETFLEKAVELGVSRITPLLTERTEKEGLREKRSHNILVAAMKQSGRSRLPTLEDPTALGEVVEGLPLEGLPEAGYDRVLIAHEGAGSGRRLMRVLDEGAPAKRMIALVGPEGGFSEEEVSVARKAGGQVVSLGPRRLRTETAGLVLAAAVSLANQE